MKTFTSLNITYNIRDDPQKILDKLNIPKISEVNKKKLDKQLCIDEVSEAIGALKPRKTAGPDLYKHFKEKVITPLYEMYLESF